MMTVLCCSDIPDDGIKDESEDEDENADVTKKDPLSSKSLSYFVFIPVLSLVLILRLFNIKKVIVY